MKKRFVLLVTVSAFLGLFFEIFQHSVNENSLFEGLKLFRYFTVQSNFIVFGYFLLIVLFPKIDQNKYHAFFGGVQIYIFITMSVFFIFLERIYNPTGLSLIGSIFSHYITPLLVITFFVLNREDYDFKIKHLLLWITYPLIYLLFAIVHGFITDDFLYPFFQVSEIGILGLIVSILSLISLFTVLSFLLVKIVSKE